MADGDTYDCFLSHNSTDKPAARALAERLRRAGLSVWLDDEQLRPGVSWLPLLEAGIRASSSIAVLIGPHGLGPWQDQEVQAALSLAVQDRRPVIPVLLPGAPAAPDLPPLLVIRGWVDLRPDPDGQAGFDQLTWGITGAKPGPDRGASPGPGPRSAAGQPAPAIDAQTWDRQRLVLRDLLVALPVWELVPERRAFVKDALGDHPAAANLGWNDDGYTLASNLVRMLRYFDAVPLADGRYAVCGLVGETRARGWDRNPQIGDKVRRLADAFGCRDS
jgi:hypothetical protein